MKQREEDIESSAQLLSKETQSSSSEEFEYEDSEHSQSWSTPQRSENPIWRRLQSVQLPSWVPARKFNPKYFVFGVVVSLLITLLIFNPYSPVKPTQHQEEVEVPHTTTQAIKATSTIISTPKTTSTVVVSEAATPTSASAKPTPTPQKTHPSASSQASSYKRPKPSQNPKFCTTWPVDEKGEYELKPSDGADTFKLDSIAPKGGWKKPEGIKVIGMVFYGRKRYVDILDCYLQQNLVSNGGYFDEVWFMAHTKEEDDVAWVEDLVSQTPEYKIVGKGDCEGKKYSCMWNYAVEDNTIYVKIDDDIVSEQLHSRYVFALRPMEPKIRLSRSLTNPRRSGFIPMRFPNSYILALRYLIRTLSRRTWSTARLREWSSTTMVQSTPSSRIRAPGQRSTPPSRGGCPTRRDIRRTSWSRTMIFMIWSRRTVATRGS